MQRIASHVLPAIACSAESASGKRSMRVSASEPVGLYAAPKRTQQQHHHYHHDQPREILHDEWAAHERPRFADLDALLPALVPKPLVEVPSRPPFRGVRLLNHQETRTRKKQARPRRAVVDVNRISDDPVELAEMSTKVLLRACFESEESGFLHPTASVSTVATEVIKEAHSSTAKRPPDAFSTNARRAQQTAADLKALKSALRTHGHQNPRIEVVQRLLGWETEGEPWNNVQRGMCLRWLAWVHACNGGLHTDDADDEASSAPPVRYMSRETAELLIGYMLHLRLFPHPRAHRIIQDVIRERSLAYWPRRKASGLDRPLPTIPHPARAYRAPPAQRYVDFDLLLLRWTHLWGSWDRETFGLEVINGMQHSKSSSQQGTAQQQQRTHHRGRRGALGVRHTRLETLEPLQTAARHVALVQQVVGLASSALPDLSLLQRRAPNGARESVSQTSSSDESLGWLD